MSRDQHELAHREWKPPVKIIQIATDTDGDLYALYNDGSVMRGWLISGKWMWEAVDTPKVQK